MTEVAATATPPSERSGDGELDEPIRARALTIGLAVLLAVTWCSEGARVAVGLPHAVVGVVDIAELALAVWLGIGLVLRYGIRWVSPLVVVYGVWVALGLVTSAPAAAVVTSLKYLLLLPALALVVAAHGARERQARVLVGVLLVLGALEFVVTLVQSFGTTSSDSITGTFGPSANAVVGAVVLLIVSLAVAGFLVRAPSGSSALALAFALPIFSAWTLVKLVPVIQPLVVLAVAVPAIALRRTTLLRALVALAATMASSAVVIGSYAAFHRDSFDALFNRNAASNYLASAAITGAPGPTSGAIGNVVISNYANASVATHTVAFTVTNTVAGDYTAWVSAAGGTYHVAPGRRYVFRATAASTAAALQYLQPQIEWRDGAGHLLGISLGHEARLPGGGAGPLFARLAAIAPAHAATAMPKFAVTGSPPAGSSITVAAASVAFTPGGRPATAPSPPTVAAPAPAAAPAAPVPGRLTQWRMAEDAISGSAASELFGTGLGAATVADGLGVQTQDLSPDAAAASYSDFGTLLVERGWVGVGLVSLFALALVLAALRLFRSLPSGCWTTAYTTAVPGAVAVMAAYGMIADQLRNRAAALTFWLIVALGLSPLLERARSAARRGRG